MSNIWTKKNHLVKGGLEINTGYKGTDLPIILFYFVLSIKTFYEGY